jgi:hypothetical protein
MGLHIPAVPVWHSLGYKYGRSTKQTYNRAEVEKMKAAVDADVAACTSCQRHKPGEMMPGHYTGRYDLTEDKAYGYTYHCQSWSRWYNPETGKMEGHAHCTCDYCF